MDLATIIGFVTAFGLILVSIGSGLSAFGDGPSVMIVLGGTFGAALIHYRFEHMKIAMAVVKQAFLYKPLSPADVTRTMVDYAQQARREGILVLEAAAQNTEEPFLQQALQLAVDGHQVDAIEAILATEVDHLKDRHKLGAEIFSSLGGYAPALGMIGTLVGLVLMLQNMDDPSQIGPSMAVALLTTFYGAILSNLVFNPIAGKLKSRSAEEILYKELVTEGILSISQGDNPRIVEQKLTSFLQPSLREAASAKK